MSCGCLQCPAHGASVIQERTQAFALKSSMLLLDPRPDLPLMVRMVEQGFALSEASNMPAILQLRIRACHVRGTFECKDNIAPTPSMRTPLKEPAAFDYARLAHPPVTFGHEKLKGEQRIPAARRFIAEHGLNEIIDGKHDDVGLIVQGGLYNALIRAQQQFGLADAFGATDIPLLVLNVTFSTGARAGGGILHRQARGARAGRGPAGVHRTGDRHAAAPARHPDAVAWQGPPAAGRRVLGRGDRGRPARIRAPPTYARGHRAGPSLARRQP